MTNAAGAPKLITNAWRRNLGQPYEEARILSHAVHPEGIDVDRLRFFQAGMVTFDSKVGHMFGILRGRGTLYTAGPECRTFRLRAGTHVYVPPGSDSRLEATEQTEVVRASAGSAAQAGGDRILIRDETFVAACASGSHAFRWILTPQYLSRRIFLYHDPVLRSRSGSPISWFRTTMFDVTGLPHNASGEPVFKMSYNSRTEFNVCYDVTGIARVRMAQHPYSDTCQMWGPWLALDGDTTYHLNEVAGGSDEECRIDPRTNRPEYLRNKHEVHIADGYVSLICIFDPAPTGIEHHRPGEYSDYEPLSRVAGTELYQRHRRDISKFDEMVDRLSRAKAEGTLSALHGTAPWELYERGREAQALIESNLHRSLEAEGRARQNIIRPWMQRNRGSMHPTPPADHTVTGPLHDARSPRSIAS
jgi:hypothetical protein